MKAVILSLCGVLGALAAVAFFAQAFISYAATPSDPQKPIGYVFMFVDSLLIGGALFGLSSALALLLGWRDRGKSLLGLIALAIICGAILSAILTHHWRDLFPRTRPDEAVVVAVPVPLP